MIFKVKNLGYIEEAEVDLSKDLIVFTGHNNTGKTYLAYAIYFLYWINDDVGMNVFNTVHDEDLPNYVKEYATELIKNRKLNIYPLDTTHLIDENILKKGIEKSLNNGFFNMSNHIFQTDSFDKIEFQITSFSEKFIKSILTNKNSLFDRVGEPIGYHINDDYIIYGTSCFDTVFYNQVQIEEINKKSIENNESEIAINIHTMMYENIIFPFWNKNIYIAPAERNAINIFSKELSLTKNRVLKNKNGASKDIQFLNRYPLPIQDNLEIAEDLAHLSRNKSDFVYLAEELEQDFLKGRISTNQYGQIEYTPDNTDKINLEVHLTASMVKSLSNIVFYLRHLAQKGDCIIIDEPELNLHPDNQRKIARFIGRLVNEGFQVVISTHSDYIIKELNNMIMLSKAKGERDDLIQNLGFRGDELLKPEQVEAQLFTLNSRRPQKIPITDEGFEVTTINEVIEQQDNDLEKIYYELFQKVM